MSPGAPTGEAVAVPVVLGSGPGAPVAYEVVVGPGVRHRLAGALPPGARRAAVVTQASVARHWTVATGLAEDVLTIPEGEEAKTLATVEDLCRAFSRSGLTRADVVVAVGGGVVTDAAGFAAAVYHRGVAVVHVPTTLLAQVDAAIGGKTGVNLPEGKNLVGAFWQPRAVLCDTDTLATLDDHELRNGLGEMAKYAFLGVDVVGADPLPPLAERVAASVRCKVAHLAGDERDLSGRRALLNYGHTLAHALEARAGYRLGHGEAVAVGLAFAARLARALGRVDDARVRVHDDVLARCGLATALPAGADPEALVAVMARDKKALAGLTFVLDGPRGPEVVAEVEPATVAATLAAMAAEARG